MHHKRLTMHERARYSGGRISREASMRDETVFGVTYSRYHTNPWSDPVFFRRRCNGSTPHVGGFSLVATGTKTWQPTHANPIRARRSGRKKTACSKSCGSPNTRSTKPSAVMFKTKANS